MFWVKFQESSEILQDLSEDEQSGTPSYTNSDRVCGDGGELIFGCPSTPRNLITLHSSQEHIIKLWHIFLDRVNPLTRLLHAPTVQELIYESCKDLEGLPKNTEVLMLAIYACAVISLSEVECEEMFGETKAALQGKYQFGTQQALVRAEFLKTSDLIILQAYILFLVR